jgi:hypothetical protein
MPGNKCSNCIAYNYECMYVEAAKVLVFNDDIWQFLTVFLVRNEDHPRGLSL